MFQGASEVNLDAKGRLAVPTRHREPLASGGGAVVLTAHPDGCLLLYPKVAWEPIGARIQALSSFNEQARWWQRLLVGFAEELELDGSGRILVSPPLRKFASLKKEVMLVGQGSHFELWDVEAWDQKLAQAMTMAGSAPPPGTENFAL
ncbi:MAG: division/cell wall cluster transcriptional repressor MraZ [Burkholderiales bacterium]|nr:division/cell wall cluster transcriptional repressor MraZ [Burkholderiales bacterium]